jgi:hypothetical protein
MTADDFRKIALSMSELSKSPTWDTPFSGGRQDFAKLPDETRGMVSLTPEMQKKFTEEKPETFIPVNGWGLKGATYVQLKTADKAIVRRAMMSEWPKRALKPS